MQKWRRKPSLVAMMGKSSPHGPVRVSRQPVHWRFRPSRRRASPPPKSLLNLGRRVRASLHTRRTSHVHPLHKVLRHRVPVPSHGLGASTEGTKKRCIGRAVRVLRPAISRSFVMAASALAAASTTRFATSAAESMTRPRRNYPLASPSWAMSIHQLAVPGKQSEPAPPPSSETSPPLCPARPKLTAHSQCPSPAILMNGARNPGELRAQEEPMGCRRRVDPWPSPLALVYLNHRIIR
jgi:hypothetical protein